MSTFKINLKEHIHHSWSLYIEFGRNYTELHCVMISRVCLHARTHPACKHLLVKTSATQRDRPKRKGWFSTNVYETTVKKEQIKQFSVFNAGHNGPTSMPLSRKTFCERSEVLLIDLTALFSKARLLNSAENGFFVASTVVYRFRGF